MDKYVWRKDGTQVRISFVENRGGVEVVNANGDTLREVDTNKRGAKKVMAELEKEFSGTDYGKLTVNALRRMK